MEAPLPAPAAPPTPSPLEALRELASRQREQINRLTAEVKALRIRLPKEGEQLEDLQFEGKTYQPLVVAEFTALRLLTDVERRGRVPLPKLPRLGESLPENVRRSEKDPQFLQALALYKGTAGKTNKDILAALTLFEELAAQNNIPARMYVVKISMNLYGLTDWKKCLEILQNICELAIRGYPPALFYLGWKLARHPSGILTHHLGAMLGSDWQSMCLNSAVELGYWRAALVQLNQHRGNQRYRDVIKRAAEGADGEEPSLAAKYIEELTRENEPDVHLPYTPLTLYSIRSGMKVYPRIVWHIDSLPQPKAKELWIEAAELGIPEAHVRLALSHWPELWKFTPKRIAMRDGFMRDFSTSPRVVFNETPMPAKAVEYLLKALENNSYDAAVTLWALSRHPPAAIADHPSVNITAKRKFLEIAARFGSVSALRKLRGKLMNHTASINIVKMCNLRVFPQMYLPADVLALIFCRRKYTLKDVLALRLVSQAWLAYFASAPLALRVRCSASHLRFIRRFVGMRYVEIDVLAKRLLPLCAKELRSIRLYGRTPVITKELLLMSSLLSLSFHTIASHEHTNSPLLAPPYLTEPPSALFDISPLVRLTSLMMLGNTSRHAVDHAMRAFVSSISTLTNLHTLVAVNSNPRLEISTFTSLTQLSRLALHSSLPPMSHHINPPPSDIREFPSQVLLAAIKPLTNLTALDLYKQYSINGTEMTDLIAPLRYLTSLVSSATPVEFVINGVLQHFPTLASLALVCDCTGISASRLSDLVSLTALRVHTAEECGLANLQLLTYLELSSDCIFRLHTAKAISSLPRLRHFGAIYDNCAAHNRTITAGSVDPAVICRVLPTYLTSLRLSVASSTVFSSFQYMDSTSLPILFARLSNITNLDLRTSSVLALQELRTVAILKNLRTLSLEGIGVSDEVLDAILAANPHLDPAHIRLMRPLHPDAYVAALVRRGCTVETLSHMMMPSLSDVFVTSSLDAL